MNQPAAPHPWIAALQAELDGLEAALLRGDAVAVERASAQVQAALCQAPDGAGFGIPGSTLRRELLQAAQRFGQLRHAVQRASAQSQRDLRSLMPGQSAPTYGRQGGRTLASGGGFLAA